MVQQHYHPLTNPTYSGGILTWTATLAADVTVPAGQAIALHITTAQAGVNFRIDFDSQTKPSRIDLPVSTFINILSLDVYTAAYPGGIPVVKWRWWNYKIYPCHSNGSFRFR